jgi:hypothetical protein
MLMIERWRMPDPAWLAPQRRRTCMTRLLAASLFLGLAATPVLACDYYRSVTTDTKPSTVAAQPATPATCPTCVIPGDTTTAPQTKPTPRKPS